MVVFPCSVTSDVGELADGECFPKKTAPKWDVWMGWAEMLVDS